MQRKESLISARYAVAILKVAKGAPQQEAVKLIEGLLKDRVNLETDEKIAIARADTRNACEQLALALRANSPTPVSVWERAAHAAERWIEVVQENPTPAA